MSAVVLPTSTEIQQRINDLEAELKDAELAIQRSQIVAAKAWLTGEGDRDAASAARELALHVQDLLAGLRRLSAQVEADEIHAEIARREDELKRARGEAQQRRDESAKLEHERKTNGAAPQYVSEHAILAARNAVHEVDSQADQIERGIESLRSRCRELVDQLPDGVIEHE